MAKVLKEITDWDVAYRQPNHTYLVSGDKVLAYRVYHTGEIRKVNVKLDRRRRKFVEQAFNPADWPVDVASNPNIVIVQGSKGNTYEVDVEKGTCTCTGFKFRGDCKHIGEANEQDKKCAA